MKEHSTIRPSRHVVFVHTDSQVTTDFKRCAELQDEFRIKYFNDHESAWQHIHANPTDVQLLITSLGKSTEINTERNRPGLDLISKIQEHHPDIPVATYRGNPIIQKQLLRKGQIKAALGQNDVIQLGKTIRAHGRNIPTRVLIYEPDTFLATMLKDKLESHGHRARIISDPVKAAHYIQKNRDEIDLFLPDLSHVPGHAENPPGLGAVHMAREFNLPVIATTTRNDSKHIDDLKKRHGIIQVMRKPEDLEKLIPWIEQHAR